MKILQIIGARPQFMKYFAVFRALQEYGDSVTDILVHTGQHYDYNMSKIFFDELGLKEPDHHLNVGSGSHGFQTAQIIERTEELLKKYKPDCVIVYGDTNSTIGGALAASKLHIPVAHVEAGLRSYNKLMPEEQNRLLADHISTYLFCPSKTAVNNLRKEGFTSLFKEGAIAGTEDVENPVAADVDHPVVVNSGDVMYDTILHARKIAGEKSVILDSLGVVPGSYSVLTMHRAENTDDPVRFKQMVGFVNDSANGKTIIFPMHPRTRKVYEEAGISFSPNVRIIEPVGYFDLIHLLDKAHILMTDSGGMQKEAYWLDVPCITLRDETEWTETVDAGWNVLYKNYNGEVKPPQKKEPVYGDGNAAEIIVRYLVNSMR